MGKMGTGRRPTTPPLKLDETITGTKAGKQVKGGSSKAQSIGQIAEDGSIYLTPAGKELMQKMMAMPRQPGSYWAGQSYGGYGYGAEPIPPSMYLGLGAYGLNFGIGGGPGGGLNFGFQMGFGESLIAEELRYAAYGRRVPRNLISMLMSGAGMGLDFDTKLMLLMSAFNDTNEKSINVILTRMMRNNDKLMSVADKVERMKAEGTEGKRLAEQFRTQALQHDSSVDQAVLTQLIRERTKFQEMIANAQKAIYDAKMNAVRKIN